MLKFEKRHPPVGARVGTLVINEDSPTPKIHVISYTRGDVREQDVADCAELKTLLSGEGVHWIDVQGYGDETTIRAIGKIFSIHPLAMEDVVNVPQRPKAEAYDDQLLIITRMVSATANVDFNIEQVSIFLGSNYVLTFQEQYGDVFDAVRDRIRTGKGRPIRKHGADYLAYAIYDCIVDGYYPVLEKIGDRLEELENIVLEQPTPALLRTLNQTKNNLANLRRSIWPQRDAVNNLIRDENPLMSAEVRMFLRDTYDHCVQATDVVEMYRETVSGLMNTYLSSVANRTNEVMKVLTIMASIFIPLTFLAGIYGMNFEAMPELKFAWAYPLLLFVMFFVAAGMFWFFYHKGWIGSRQDQSGMNEKSDP